MAITMEMIEQPGPEIESAILARMLEYNLAAWAPPNHRPVAIVLRDPVGVVVGGLWGGCFYDWLIVRMLVVPEVARGRGHGRALMAAAERIAREHDATGIWLDTFSFQARGFYEKLGFTCFGELPDHPIGGARFFMQKRL